MNQSFKNPVNPGNSVNPELDPLDELGDLFCEAKFLEEIIEASDNVKLSLSASMGIASVFRNFYKRGNDLLAEIGQTMDELRSELEKRGKSHE